MVCARSPPHSSAPPFRPADTGFVPRSLRPGFLAVDHPRMRRLILALTFTATAAFAQEQRFILAPPDASRFVVRKNIEYAPKLVFDLYRPPGDAVVPVVIFANVGISGMKEWAGYVGWGQAVAAA